MAAAAISSWVPEKHLHARLGPQPTPVTGSHLRASHSHTTPATSPVSLDESRGTESASEHDPHHLPTFDSKTLTAPSTPILYLPPLLSSLPPGYSQPQEPTGTYRPLTTETRLPDIDPVSLHLHKALHSFHPLTSEYSVIPYEDAFNWKELRLPEDSEREWYCVVFRSKRKEGSDGGPLYEADKQAHEEAVQNGGLILYWYGIPHPETGLNLATCIWQSRAHAIAANSKPHHVRAMRLAAASYERYELARYRLRKVRGERDLRVEPYDSGDVGW